MQTEAGLRIRGTQTGLSQDFEMSLSCFQDERRPPIPYVLLVSPERGASRGLEQLLVERGFAVEVVREVEWIAGGAGHPQCIVFDAPGLETAAVIRRLREEHPETRVVVVGTEGGGGLG